MTIESTFPPSGRRVIFYLIYDARGNVDDYIPYKLERLRPFADCIVVIFNGVISDTGRAALEPFVDELWERKNVGFDVGGYAMALERFGEARLAEFDELILMNYTWFGPVRPFEPLFDRMNALHVGFWGITDHGPTDPNPVTFKGVMPSHIQSHWIAVRSSVFLTEEWKRYWGEMPRIKSYRESILLHESRFTEHFERLGHSYAVAFPHENYAPSMHPAFENAITLLDDGCPVVKRRPFFHDPLYLDREAIIGRWLVQSATSQGYPERFIWQSMTRSATAKILYTNASMMEILPSDAVRYDGRSPLRTVAIVHIYYEDMTDELLDRLSTLPSQFDLVVTTSDEAKAEVIRSVIERRTDLNLEKSEIRIVPSNRGRDQSAFYVTCRDVLLSEEYDLVVKVHSKRSAQDGAGPGTFFKRQQLDNLLYSPGYTANLVELFQREPGLGAVYPPMIHIGYPTMGNAWFTNFDKAKALMKKLGIKVALDESSPLAPYGGMFIARPKALLAMTRHQWDFEDYAPEGKYGDGTLSHVQERLVAYAAAELGFHTRTVANADYAAISHTFLEYKLDQMSAGLSGFAYDQIHAMRPLVKLVDGGQRSVIAYLLLRYHFRIATMLLFLTKPLRRRRRARREAKKAKAATP
ncbi:rhamnan synthesis F family protein [Glaciihabitans sp. UYNi722]|uniref:rhamnan synthesis F family protein n=1 Tax=Glaciihabitans sp. UYNi722 TaxID=3156344 RepID=UPI003395655D